MLSAETSRSDSRLAIRDIPFCRSLTYHSSCILSFPSLSCDLSNLLLVVLYFVLQELDSIDFTDKSMPARIFHNTALHLAGPGRSFGAVILGNFQSAVRVVVPKSVSSAMACIGGINVLLSMVAMSTSVEMLYSTLKCLVGVVSSSKEALREMEEKSGFQVGVVSSYADELSDVV